MIYILSTPLTQSNIHKFHEKSVSIIDLRWMKSDNKWDCFELHPWFHLHSELHRHFHTFYLNLATDANVTIKHG